MGEPVRIQVLGAESGMGTLEDPRFTLYDPAGNELGEYDDSETSLEPNILFTPGSRMDALHRGLRVRWRSGTYSLVVTAAFSAGAASSQLDNTAAEPAPAAQRSRRASQL